MMTGKKSITSPFRRLLRQNKQLLKKNIYLSDCQLKKSVFLQPKILEQKELKIKKLKGKKVYAYHSTISKKGKKKTYRSK